MRDIKSAVSSILAIAAMTGAAAAADSITYATSEEMAVPIHDTAPAGTDWNGFYAGLLGTVVSAPDSASIGLGVTAGVNAAFDIALVGGEVTFQGLATDESAGGAEAQLLARGGLLVSDDVMLYGAAGYGIDLNDNDQNGVRIGGGLEYAITDEWSLRAQYLREFPGSGEEAGNQFSVGAMFHF